MARDGNLNDPALRARAVEAAQGKCPFDLLIENVHVLDMVTGRERRADIGIVGPLIGSVLPPSAELDAVTRIDGEGAFAVPGLIDTHMHIESSMVTPAEYAAAVLPRGVTTAVWDPHEFANACGVSGVEFAIQATGDLPLRVLTLAPTCVPSAPGYESCGGDFGPETVARLLKRPDISGAAELMTMQPLLNGDPRVAGIANAAVASGKLVCGHARGLSGGNLAAYAAAGVESDHELTSAADLLARLEAGMTVELRGSHEHLLPELAQALVSLGHMPQTVTLCTDDVFPDDLYAHGGLDRVLRLLMAHGLPAALAYRAATLNAAGRLGRADLGLLAPGRRADVVLIPDLREVSAKLVLADGKPVAQSGTLEAAMPTTRVPQEMNDTVRLPELAASDFEIAAEGSRATIATLSKPRFPVWSRRDVAVTGGRLELPDDMLRMAVANRYGRATPVRVAFLENWGTWRGAFASTVSHDSHNLTVFGRNPSDMALAANAVRAAGGGLAVASEGRVMAQLELPIAGLVSDRPLEEVADIFSELRQALDALIDWEPPYLVFKALFGASLVCNAGPRLSDVGLVDVFEGRILESCIIDSHDT
ncbi:adenine deaminase [Hoeflea poritis]|uniref:Adenine deaminase n=1 Tax=Hoeflea poritis TaxID=2993659 RepID=A0ABT4VS83_9HYPH|nr:adenine deaminase C-terminal domain-containing protein [Hoeflea poritis]MDA4847558.1 amidohydrolase family protein [Hoeflea poritis]